jgi:torulene dioxygenase
MAAITDWDPEREALFYVIDREAGGIIARYKVRPPLHQSIGDDQLMLVLGDKTDPYFCFHTINAYDKGDDIIIDLTAYDDHSVLSNLTLDNMRFPREYPKAAKSSPKRFLLPNVSSVPQGTTASAKVVFYCAKTKTMELPTIHPDKYHRKYRYCYGISIGGGPEVVISDEILKLDMDHPGIESAEVGENGSGQVWREEGCVPGEPIFIPRPGGTKEDDGVVLTVVLDSTLLRSKLVILDAETMKEIARAEMKTIFPVGFHGTFVGATP